MADKALLLGINQYQRVSDLRGCVNDVHSIQTLLTGVFGFAAENVHTRTNEKVTKKVIQKQWKWLLSSASPGDRLVFHFSGHGSYTADEDGDETDDGVDELICLYDMDWDNRDSYLLDDDLREMASRIPQGVDLTILLDCCHSGTATRVLRMPGQIDDETELKLPAVDIQTSVARWAMASAGRLAAMGDERAAAEIQRVIAPESTADASSTVLVRFVPPPAWVQQKFRRAGVRRPLAIVRDQPMNHVLFSGSQSDQTAADAQIEGDYHGAFTYYFCEIAHNRGGN